MVGAFSISGVPLFNGFVSKSMVVSAAAESGRPVVELLLILASIGTFLHTGLKLPYFTFFGASARVQVRPLPRNMLAAMALAAFLCAGLGLVPGWLYARLPLGAVYRPYTVDHVVAALQLLIGTGAAFALLLPKLAGEPTVSLDADWLYRRPLRRALGLAVTAAERGGRRAEQAASVSLGALAALAEDPSRAFRRVLDGKGPHGPAGGPFDPDLRRQPVGTVVLWVTAALGLATLVLG
jgi:multicomponent Na+:H+ antiporter subunit D